MLLATGLANGVVNVWDLKGQNVALRFTAGPGAVNSVVFSENGYHVATVSGSGDSGVARVWDLRKLAKAGGAAPHLAELGGGFSSVQFDSTGQYVAASGKAVSVFNSKAWDTVVVSHDSKKKPFVGAVFGPLAESITAACADGSVYSFAK